MKNSAEGQGRRFSGLEHLDEADADADVSKGSVTDMSLDDPPFQNRRRRKEGHRISFGQNSRRHNDEFSDSFFEPAAGTISVGYNAVGSDVTLDPIARPYDLLKSLQNPLSDVKQSSTEPPVRSSTGTNFGSVQDGGTFAATSPASGFEAFDLDTFLSAGVGNDSWGNDFEAQDMPIPSIFRPISPFPDRSLRNGSAKGSHPSEDPRDYNVDSQQAPLPLPEGLQGRGLWKLSEDDSNLGAADLRDECIQKLSELSSALLKELGQLDSGKTASTTSTWSSGWKVPDPMKKPKSQTHDIGKMLHSSEKFLEILQHFVRYESSHSSASNAASLDASDSEHHHEGLFNPPRPAWSLSPNSSTASTSHLCPDMTTTLAILTCYTCLIRIYGGVFSHIHNSLLAYPSAREDSLPMLPGLQLDGFELGSHRNLQIQVLTQVSSHMISQIEKRLEDVGISSGEGSVCAGLLDIVVRQDEEGGKARLKMLRQVMKSIRQLLNDTGAL